MISGRNHGGRDVCPVITPLWLVAILRQDLRMCLVFHIRRGRTLEKKSLELKGVNLWYVCKCLRVSVCVSALRSAGLGLICVRFSLAGSNSPAVSNEVCSTYCLCFTREITLWSSSSPSPSSLRKRLAKVWAAHHLNLHVSVPFSLLYRCPCPLDARSDDPQRIKSR